MPVILTMAKGLAAMSGVLAALASVGSVALFCTGGVTAKSRFAVVRTAVAVLLSLVAVSLAF